MANDDLKTLLEFMPEIAAAVNAFTSETTQRDALAALLSAYSGRAPSLTPETPRETVVAMGDSEEPTSILPPPTTEKSSVKRPRKNGGSGSKDSFKLIKDLDLHPSGKKSFAEFINEKMPKSNEDRFAATVYWFAHIAEIQPVSVHHIGTAFRFTQGWREPNDLTKVLRTTASRKGTIDTSKMEDIRTTPRGRNFVEHDLPPEVAAKK